MLSVGINHVAAWGRGEEAHMHIISLDTHKHYSLARVETPGGELVVEQRIEHCRGAIRRFLKRFDPGSPVAIETSGNYYWIVAEIEEAEMVPKLVNAPEGQGQDRGDQLERQDHGARPQHAAAHEQTSDRLDPTTPAPRRA